MNRLQTRPFLVALTAIAIAFAASPSSLAASDDDKEKKPAKEKAKGKSKGKKKEKEAKKLVTRELHVTGMSCHNCSDAVEDALAAIKGVEVESVNAKSNLAVVKYDPKSVKADQIEKAIAATKQYVLAPTVEYAKLNYESDGSFSLDGKPFTGTATDAHKNGKPAKNYQFEKGKLHGLIREWFENGKMSGKKMYKEGKRHGKTEYWDEKGKLTATKMYQDDVHIEEEKEEEAGKKK